jgi:hypothetical protein
VLEIATATGTTRARGAASAKRLSESFEDVVEAVCSSLGHVVRGHPASKVVRTPTGQKTVYTAKNGVDFVGVVCGLPVAIEAKRLPGAASLSGAKDDSTRAEAAWLHRYIQAGGCGGFLVFDPDEARVYVVEGSGHLSRLAIGGPVALRDRKGAPQALAFVTDDPTLETAVRRAVKWLATGRMP